MSVLPKGLISREQMKGVKGVETIRNTLLPTTNAPFSPSGNNRVIFNVLELHEDLRKRGKSS